MQWGVIGTGLIASVFTEDLRLLPGHEVVAVGSRRQETADAFGERFGVPHRHATYESLAADPDVEAVYVSTPHPGHHAAARLAIDAGQAVLVEKAFTVSAREARDLVAAARARGTFLMEAMWMRFLPHMVRVRELIAEGAVGDVRMVTADHGQWFAKDPAHRLFAPELGGGALLDLGVYVVSLASMVLGRPERITAVSDPAFTGVDAQTVVVLQHEGGRQAVLSSTLEARTPTRATIVGTDGYLELDRVWMAPSGFDLVRRDGADLRYDEPHEGHGLRHEAAEVGRCVAAGLTESPVMPLDETVSIMETMDEVRRQIGLRYPGE